MYTIEKARKIAEDENYTSAENSQLGKGCRKKFPNHYINQEDNTDDSVSEDENKHEDYNKNKENNSSLQVIKKNNNKKLKINVHNTVDTEKNIDITNKLPQWPSTVNSRNISHLGTIHEHSE
ncbi:hypothetical protein PUN28_004304 [Cardiocondyla obscurior]|uniref:Uncharacterized protein n=1 Tax=Cardiocondyla obscurior TaxID=286306 RepID=A0AAW2E838_9HYME